MSAPDPAAVRRAELAALDADVRAVLERPARAGAAKGRILARLTGGTAAQNAAALDDVFAAVQRELVRQGG